MPDQPDLDDGAERLVDHAYDKSLLEHLEFAARDFNDIVDKYEQLDDARLVDLVAAGRNYWGALNDAAGNVRSSIADDLARRHDDPPADLREVP